jgi:hypothetical protein
MPIYHLKPIPALLDDPAWVSSRMRGEAWVNGADEAEARALASGQFQDATGTVPGHAAPVSPWREARLVAATLCERAPEGMTIPNGTVVSTSQS